MRGLTKTLPRGAMWLTVDQLLSMGSNLVVTVALLRRGGEAALGTFAAVAAVFTIYLAVQRATLSEPAAAARRQSPDDAVAASSLLALSASLPVATVLLMVSLLGLPALLPFAVFLPVLAVQDNARYMSSRVGRPQIAVGMDGLWLVLVIAALLTFPHALGSSLIWLWAASGAVSALPGVALVTDVPRLPRSVKAAFSWWRRECVTVSRATGLDMFLSQTYAQGTVFLVLAVIGLSGAGQYRAAQSLFGGCMATIVALNMYALPRLRGRGSSRASVVSLGWRYLAAVAVVGAGTLLLNEPAQRLVFGHVVVSQQLAMATFVLFCLLSLSSAQATALRVHAATRQRLLLRARSLMLLVGTATMLAASTSGSLVLVTWGQAAGVLTFVLAVYSGLRPERPRVPSQPRRRAFSSFAVHSTAVDLRGIGSAYCAVRGLDGLRPTSATDLVIEGFPRSANTYAKAAFLDANPAARVASHLHSASSVRWAARHGIPVIVLVREPLDAVASLLVRDDRVHPRSALKAYLRFYVAAAEVRDRVLVADFDEVTDDFGAVTSRLNMAFGSTFCVFRGDHEAQDRVRSEIDRMEIRFAGGVLDEKAVARPSETRRAANAAARSTLLLPEFAELLDSCRRARSRLLEGVGAVQPS